MDWQSIIIKIVSALLATLGAWVLAKVKSLINTKIKNEKARNLLQGATNVVSNAVKATYQTYVESSKSIISNLYGEVNNAAIPLLKISV